MTTFKKIEIAGVEITQVETCQITKILGEANSSSKFIATINNYKGDFSTLYSIGDEIKIYVDKDVNPATTLVFLGILENINLTGKSVSERLVISGRDYSARLMDRTVEPSTYNNQIAGTIVIDLINKYTDDITTNNVDDGLIVDRIVFNHIPVFDAIKQLANFSDNYIFYIDESKDLHFKQKSTIISGQTFNNTNIIKTTFKEKRNTIYNEVWVYGDRYLDGYQEEFTGKAKAAGSEYILGYSPHNTTVINSGTTPGLELIQPGGIFEMTFGAGSQFKYLVNFSDKKIILTSGTLAGDNLYTGSKILINYMRDLPIVKFGDNDASISRYGRRVKVIQDKSIKDPLTAETILLRELDEFSDPIKEGTLFISGISNLNVGETCIVDIPIYEINNITYDILEVKYNLTKRNMLADEVLSIKVNKKIEDITDTIKGLLLEQRKLQSAEMQTTDLLTRYKISPGSLGIRTSGIEVWTIPIADSFVLGHPDNAVLGTDILGRDDIGSTLEWSGGYF